MGRAFASNVVEMGSRRFAAQVAEKSYLYSVNAESSSDPRVRKIEFMWDLFNALPNNAPRLIKTQMAAQRMEARKNIAPALPDRSDFQTTAAYFEAVMPLAVARHRFLSAFKPSSFMLDIHRALGRIALKSQINTTISAKIPL